MRLWAGMTAGVEASSLRKADAAEQAYGLCVGVVLEPCASARGGRGSCEGCRITLTLEGGVGVAFACLCSLCCGWAM